MANRGGLSSPSECTFAVATLGAKFYRAMMNGPPTVLEEFHKRKNHQQVFVDSVHETVRSNDMLQCLLSTRCNQLHCDFKLILNVRARLQPFTVLFSFIVVFVLLTLKSTHVFEKK